MIFAFDGISAYASTAGRPFMPKQRSVLFLHGAGMDHTAWGMIPRWFSGRGWNALALDLPGHGRSAGPPLTRIEDYAVWVARAVEAVGVDRVAVVGHSMGAAIALEFAARAPEDVASVVMFGAGLRMPVNPAMIASAETDGRETIAMMIRYGFARGAKMGPSPFPGLDLTGWTRRLLSAAKPGVLAADLKACDAWDGEAAAPELRRFATVVVCDEDRLTPPSAGAALAGKIDGSVLERRYGVGHMSPLEAPEVCREILIEAL